MFGSFLSKRSITNYGIYRHDLKVHHPPKQTTKLWRLPVHRKLVYVSPGWFYRKDIDGEAVKTNTSCVTIMKSGSHKLLESLTKEEFQFLMESRDSILDEFSKVESLRPALEEVDLASQHICRY